MIGVVDVPVASVAATGVGHGVGRLTPEEGVAVGVEN